MYTISHIGGVYLARSAIVVGDVTMGTDCNVWHGCVIRGDVAPIHIGDRVNIQDGAVLHCKIDVPLEIASDVVIAHLTLIHGRSIGPGTLIGSRAIVLDDCEVGEDCLVAAGSLLAPGTVVPPGSVVMGTPGRVVRAITDPDRAYIRRILTNYVELAKRHAAGEFRPYGGSI
jgi:gamma-carbonic anhydrase